MTNKLPREALAQAVEESGKHPAELVRGITTERTLERWIKGETKPNPFASRRIARRLGRPYEELFNG